MTNLTRIKLCRLTPLHLGTGRESHDVSASILESDTLTAALASLRAQHGRAEGLDAFLRSFTLSSAFPYDGDEYFLPRMSGRLPIAVRGQEEEQYRKRLKKLQFVSASLWQRLVRGERLEVEDGQLQGEFLLARANTQFERPMRHAVMQRVAVPYSGTGDAEPFLFDWTFFCHGERETGLYCLLQTDSTGVRDEVIRLFRELGETGIGADKSVGGGQFGIETADIEIDEPEATGRQLLLSTYIPMDSELSELSLPDSSYQLIKRSGLMAGSEHEGLRHKRRNNVCMFDTGSVLVTRQPAARLQGAVVNLRPDSDDERMHPVWRSGRPLTININQTQHEQHPS